MSSSFLPVYRSGFTGPSKNIGGSTEYHIDLKVLKGLPLQERIRAMDSLANQYQSIGRQIEFSNEAVSGKTWNPAAPLAEKVDLLERAAAAHSHSRHGGWDSYDFYVPFKGKSRFDPGAVEGASIFIPGVEGGKIRRGAGGGYGYFSEAIDPGGRVVFRVGHGDITRPEAEEVIEVAKGGQAPAGTQQAPGTDIGQQVLAGVFLGNILQNYLSKDQQAAAPKPEIDPTTGFADTDEGDVRFLSALAKKQEQEASRQEQANEREREYQEAINRREQILAQSKMAEMLKSAQEAFQPGKPVF